jgi:hypothetical protein
VDVSLEKITYVVTTSETRTQINNEEIFFMEAERWVIQDREETESAILYTTKQYNSPSTLPGLHSHTSALPSH